MTGEHRDPDGRARDPQVGQVLDEARDGLLYCVEIGAYSKAEQKGLAFVLPKLEKQDTILVCTSSEQLGNLAAEGRFDPALLSILSAGAVMLPDRMGNIHAIENTAIFRHGFQAYRAARLDGFAAVLHANVDQR